MNFKSIKKKHFQLFYKFWRFTIKGLQPWDQWATCDPEPNASLIFFFKTTFCTSLVGIVIKNWKLKSKLRATFCTFYLHLRHMGDTAKKKIFVEHFSCVICFVPPNLYCCAELGLLSSNTIWIIPWACWGWMMLV